MKCQGCKQEFSGLKELMAHKPNCLTPAVTTREKKELRQNKAASEANDLPIVEQNEPSSDGLFIPLSMCPEEIQLYAQNHTVGLRVTGILTPTGVKIQEVTLIR